MSKVKINPKYGSVNLYNGWSDRISLHDLKAWCDHQISLGKTEATMELSWDYYDHLDSIKLASHKPEETR